MKVIGKRADVITIFLAAILILGGADVYADTFLPPEPFEIWSEDGTTVFRWNPGSEDNWTRGTAQAGVYQDGELVYSVENLPILGASASNFFFSVDFKHLAFMPTVGQVMALGFFEEGALLRAYRINELVRDMNVVTYTVTTAMWENWFGRNFDKDNNTLTIITRDDITYVFDITTGEIIYNTAEDRPFTPLSEDSFGFFINEGGIPLWAQSSNSEPRLVLTSREPHVTPRRLLIPPPDINPVIDIPYIFIIPPLSDPTLSDWAVIDVSNAVSWGIVPQSLMSDFNQSITRAEFADLVITTYSFFMGGVIGSDDVPALEREIAERIPAFTDTNNLNVMISAYLGLITGVGDNRFDPYSSLTREQAAAISSRLTEIILAYPMQTASPVIFDDAYQISEWAACAVEKMQTMGIMSGVGENRFAPQATFTREQSIVTMLRIFDLWHNEMLMKESPLSLRESVEWAEWLEWFNSLPPEKQAYVSLRPPGE